MSILNGLIQIQFHAILKMTDEIKMRIVEELDNGDKVITYYSVKTIDNKYYYVYNDVNHGPFVEFDDAVQAAVQDLIPQTVSE